MYKGIHKSLSRWHGKIFLNIQIYGSLRGRQSRLEKALKDVMQDHMRNVRGEPNWVDLLSSEITSPVNLGVPIDDQMRWTIVYETPTQGFWESDTGLRWILDVYWQALQIWISFQSMMLPTEVSTSLYRLFCKTRQVGTRR
jgi:hypothetical protein